MVHITPHAIELGISATTAANILATIGGLNIAGMLIVGGIAERIGNRQALIIGFMLMTASFLWVALTRELWMLYLFAIVFGFADGGMGPLWPSLVAELFGLRSHGLIYGVLAFGFTIGAALGPFLTGYIFDITGSYYLAFLVCAAGSIVSLVLTTLLKPIRDKSEQNHLK